MSDDQPSLDARLGSDVSEYQLQHLGSSAVMSVDETGNPHNPPGAFYCVVDEAITEVDDATGSVYTAYGFLVMWRGRQSGGYRRFHEFRELASLLKEALPTLKFPLWPFPPASWRLSADVIETRARGLQTFLSDALKLSANRGTMPLPLSKFLRLPQEEEDEAVALVQGGGGSAASNAEGFFSARENSFLDEDEQQQEDGGAASVPPTLQRMRRHLQSLRMLKERLEANVGSEPPTVQKAASSLDDLEPAYEDLRAGPSPAQLAEQFGPPLDKLEELLDALRVQYHDIDPTWSVGSDGAAPADEGVEQPKPKPPERESLMERFMPNGWLERLGMGKSGAQPERLPSARSSGKMRIVQTPSLLT